MDFQRLVHAHRAAGADVTLAVAPVTRAARPPSASCVSMTRDASRNWSRNPAAMPSSTPCKKRRTGSGAMRSPPAGRSSPTWASTSSSAPPCWISLKPNRMPSIWCSTCSRRRWRRIGSTAFYSTATGRTSAPSRRITRSTWPWRAITRHLIFTARKASSTRGCATYRRRASVRRPCRRASSPTVAWSRTGAAGALGPGYSQLCRPQREVA